MAKNKFNSKSEYPQLMAHVEHRAIFLSLLLPVILAIGFFLYDYSQHAQVAQYFTQIIRYEIVKGSMRDATYQTQRMVMRNGPFFRIRYQDDKNIDVIDQICAEGPPLFRNSFQLQLRYDDNPASKLVGTLTYYYSLKYFLLMSLMFLVLSGLSVSIFIARHRKNFSVKINEQIKKEKNEAIARTINSMAHDLRAPLNIIEIFLNHARGYSPQEYNSARQSLIRIHAMIESLKSGDIDQLVKPVFMTLDLTYIIDLMRNFATLKMKKLVVENHQDVRLAIDHPKIERVVQNLLVNALEVSSKEVTLRFENAGDKVQICVIDDGDGVPDEIASKLFQRGATFGKMGGTGLGLSYCKMVVEGHGGSISYHRREGHTVFSVELPKHLESSLTLAVNNDRRFTNFTAGILIRDKTIAEELTHKIIALFTGIEVSSDIERAVHSDVAIIDHLDLLEKLQSTNRFVIISKSSDSADTLLARFRSVISQIADTW